MNTAQVACRKDGAVRRLTGTLRTNARSTTHAALAHLLAGA
jgi:hypothetical protein